MILVLVGTHPQAFNRLTHAMDGCARKKKENVFIQYGVSQPPLFAQGKDFLNFDEYQQKIKEARVIVCHAGAGTIIDSLIAGKPTIIVPRFKSVIKNGHQVILDEHTNNHQLELALQFEKKGAIVVEEVEKIEQSIRQAHKTVSVRKNKLAQTISHVIKKWESASFE